MRYRVHGATDGNAVPHPPPAQKKNKRKARSDFAGPTKNNRNIEISRTAGSELLELVFLRLVMLAFKRCHVFLLEPS